MSIYEPAPLPVPPGAWEYAVNRLRIALTSGQPERYDPDLLLRQCLADLGTTAAVDLGPHTL